MKPHAQNLNLPVKDFTVYAFADDAPHTVRADCDLAALKQAPVPCYLVVEYPNPKPGQRFLALATADDVFEIPGGHWSDDAASAVAALKQHRADIDDHQGKRKGAVA
ncbi:hypothetical protein QC823_15840 [Halomonas vilamensis]|uniref:Uncharacterized protein n=1 Tax=Vreelandella vilamensis TaxID=531309 RepID=A0ABU1H802_9GAMM|nr:hypothetical protein [Halomonas vilamensis]MDR5900435.1 hypothetical protein [Halomonas vilamensis]